MAFDYVKNFPIPEKIIPPKLRALLDPVSPDPGLKVEIVRFYNESNSHGRITEHVHFQTAVVLDGESGPIDVFREAAFGVVETSVPIDEQGCAKEFIPSISEHDYFVASWGNGSFYTFHLAEKVWMTLGLTPRCVGNEDQRLIYDDLCLPVFGVAEGEVSSEHFWRPNRNVSWKMSNVYMRKYLWLRGARAIRSFFYNGSVPDQQALRDLMESESRRNEIEPSTGPKWYFLKLTENDDKSLLIQVWASVEVASSERCPVKSPDDLVWPGISTPMPRDGAGRLINDTLVFLDDKFLEKYEQNALFDTVPSYQWDVWCCGPSYKGMWECTDCTRVGRNLIMTSMHELYKRPDQEILHAHAFAVTPKQAEDTDKTQEHIVAKTQRLLDQLLDLGDNLSELGENVGLQKPASELVKFSRQEVRENGWMKYPNLCRLAQVAPLCMTQQAFLSRCKSLHEILQGIPDGYLKNLIKKNGCSSDSVRNLRNIKLLQALTNIIQKLNDQGEACNAFSSTIPCQDWDAKNSALAALFLNSDLRNADAHDASKKCLQILEKMGFDIALVNSGYGHALDFVFDGVIGSLKTINTSMEKFLGAR
ncbi:hypothetical protein D8B22_06005 [Verminephrobacter aporrectodeae subsp. tuberculatae]|uniref:hypothetical protein n=1 Tax=Verminephrobacter aporrectodeae TaxID=1110389 RepID=UPI0022435E08|nr:hypothetical protein [Verminephrobacter aporrectodeae]MCW8163979.1 hypothetical protein [Verminephrobacter aporrectodeae subsp. tuberculatae]MCW8168677.1 hypothetical protein [Verminephrobacter aporrectodeae subsp. tuberculatae]